MSTSGPDNSTTTVSGRSVVVIVFAFALALIAVMWGYWKLHTAPFLPLQQALAGKFPGSAPLVQGGQREIHKDTPRILRITLRVEFDPNQDERMSALVADQVVALAGEYQDWQHYHVLEIHLFQLVPEHQASKRTISFDAEELLQNAER